MGDLIGSSSLSAVVFSYVLVSFSSMTTVKPYGRGEKKVPLKAQFLCTANGDECNDLSSGRLYTFLVVWVFLVICILYCD
jgi:hypothetical protein